MSRRKSVNFVRDIGVDPRFGSVVVQKFINIIMECGKKNIARGIVYEAFDLLAKKVGNDDRKVVGLFDKALNQTKPFVEVKSRRVGGGVYQIPTEVRPSRAQTLAFRWIIESAAARSDKTMGKRLAQEIWDASEGNGSAVKKRNDVHRMAEANRAFSHYAW